MVTMFMPSTNVWANDSAELTQDDEEALVEMNLMPVDLFHNAETPRQTTQEVNLRRKHDQKGDDDEACIISLSCIGKY